MKETLPACLIAWRYRSTWISPRNPPLKPMSQLTEGAKDAVGTGDSR